MKKKSFITLRTGGNVKKIYSLILFVAKFGALAPALLSGLPWKNTSLLCPTMSDKENSYM
jgi:hypothetical protein